MLYLNNVPVNVTMFPDKTSQVWHIEGFEKLSGRVNVTWEFEHEGEFMHLAQLKTLLNSQGLIADLHMTYLPYGRQDKPISNNTTFALHSFCRSLDFLNFNSVSCMDPHSDFISNAMDSNGHNLYPVVLLNKAYELTESDLVCYPDHGALHKYSKLYSFKNYVSGEKVRDQSTGNITSYKLNGDVYDKKVLIVDDICDGGMTFKLLTKELLDAGAKEVNMFVTHGVFSKGIKDLKKSGIARIFTAKGEPEEHECKTITYKEIK